MTAGWLATSHREPFFLCLNRTRGSSLAGIRHWIPQVQVTLVSTRIAAISSQGLGFVSGTGAGSTGLVVLRFAFETMPSFFFSFLRASGVRIPVRSMFMGEFLKLSLDAGRGVGEGVACGSGCVAELSFVDLTLSQPIAVLGSPVTDCLGVGFLG